MFQVAPSRMNRSMLWDVEAPDYDKTRAFMSVRQAMEVALQCEIKAHDYFVRALHYVTDPDVHSLFEELRDEELEHQNLVRVEIENLSPDSDSNPEDYADEPVAQ